MRQQYRFGHSKNSTVHSRRGAAPGGVRDAASVSALEPAEAGAPPVTVTYQPMVSTGLAAKQPFEAWFVFDKSSDPTMQGYAVPAGATTASSFRRSSRRKAISFKAPSCSTGWSQGSIPVKFTTTQDPANPRALIIKFNEPIAAGPPRSRPQSHPLAGSRLKPRDRRRLSGRDRVFRRWPAFRDYKSHRPDRAETNSKRRRLQ